LKIEYTTRSENALRNQRDKGYAPIYRLRLVNVVTAL